MEVAQAVDASKFKTCNDLSFCRRNRNLDTAAHKYRVVDGTLTVTAAGIVQGDVVDQSTVDLYPEHVLRLEIMAVKGSNIVRMRVNEKNPLPNKKRYQVQDVLLETIEYEPFSASSIKQIHTDKQLGQYVDLAFGVNAKARLYLSPIRLDVFVDGRLAIVANSKNLFNFEHMRTRPLPPQPIPNPNPMQNPSIEGVDQVEQIEQQVEQPTTTTIVEDGTWEEKFKEHHDSKPHGPMSIGLDISFIGTTNVYGIPEHSTALSLRSTKGENINEGPYRLYNLDVFEFELDKTTALYGSIPFMISHDQQKTVGVLWLNAAETFIDISDGKYEDGQPTKDTHWISETGVMDVFFLVGPSVAEFYKQYAVLTGTTALPQLFALAYHQCRWNYRDEADVKAVDQGFDDNSIPYDVLWLDIEHTDGKRYFTWDKSNFPTPEEMQRRLADKKRKMVTIVDPHIKRDSNYYIHSEATSKGYYVKNKDGNDYEGWCWPGSSSYLDFTNKEVRDWWAQQFAYDKYQGSTNSLYIWNDMNEPSVFNGPEVSMHKDALHGGGVEHRDVHNLYGYYYHMATTQGIIERNADKNDRPFVLSRAFFAGTQRIGAIWTGDNAGQWSHLESAQPMLLSLAVAGLSFTGADVGGFFGNPDGELMTRWFQAGAFQPFFRGHAHLDAKRREPWLFGEPYTSAIRDAIVKRYTYLPLWYTLFHENSLTGLPVMRPLWVEFPTQQSLFAVDNEFMVGSSLLVRPVTQAGQSSVKVVLPGTENKQTWFDIDSDKKYFASEAGVQVDTPLDKMPVYQKGGSIVPRKERQRRSSPQMKADPYTLRIALSDDQKASGTLYTDDESSFNYQKGDYSYRQFEFAANQLTNTNLAPRSTYQPNNTIERIVIVGLKQKPSSITVNNQPLTFEYEKDLERLTIRKPDLQIKNDWSIKLN
ncbi:alpha-glucosidase II [Cavenderia fasciculata]|uniref:Glucosidase II subunit alpha n=1 Tax=Cavenderia fasciculata TaxID=261658 RepID=F4PVB4_CACFS|nr:alpha-glucosidase II [Cavenderia fasciculata]EGG19928.1 alpha-glucosidase II [Cavenderia fasciculata]|eukprot:XP_004366911.1 alpha-glucosidase II [Cavenderia fasciculata]